MTPWGESAQADLVAQPVGTVFTAGQRRLTAVRAIQPLAG
jgi:hypothetical protein